MALTLAWLARAGLLALAAAMILLPVPERPDAVATEATLEQLDALMEALDSGELDTAAAEAVADPALRPAGDVCLMRHPRLLPGVDRALRQRFAAAAFAAQNGGDEILRAIEAEATGLVAWRARFELARMAYRQRDLTAAAAFLESAATIDDLPDPCRSDMAMLAGRLATSAERAGQYFDVAVAADPGHFTAHLERALAGATARAQTPEGCIAAVDRMVTSTVALQAQMESATQLLRIAERAEAMDPGAPERVLLDGFVLERSGRPDLARARYRAALESGAVAGPCAAALRHAIGLRLQRTEG